MPDVTPFSVLRAYLEARGSFTDADFTFMEPLWLVGRYAAGEFLQRGGDMATHATFVTAGCLRKYVIDAKGKEHIVMFAPETWWIGDTTTHTTGKPSQYFIDAIEDSTVLRIDAPSHQRIVDGVPAYAAGFRAGLQKHAAAKDERIVNALATSAEERYLEFMKTYPSVAARVPQWMVASYLGITAETLSRIRKSIVSKPSPSRHQNQSR